ncbi:MAG TPA: hypothetical protein VF546_00355 [Pyrinomonadaceae bacterium]|jgi:hypothetical protein
MKTRRVGFFLLVFVPALAHAQTPAAQATRPRTVTTAALQTAATPAVAQTPAPTVRPAVVPQQPAAQRPAGTSQPDAPPAVVPSASVPPLGPAVAPTPYVPLAPLQPARPLPAARVRAHIAEAERALKTRVRPTSFGSGAAGFVTLAALDQDSGQVHLLTLPKQTFLTQGFETTLTSSRGTLLRVRVVRPNYVNTAVVVADTAGRQLAPLLVEYPIEKFGRVTELAYYTSAHPALLSPELIKAGQAYVHTMVELAARRLKDKGVTITPFIQDVAERLCLVEHVDHDRFRREARVALYEEIYALYALNELNTYRYSVSTAGAGGMVQMIPWTYQMIRQRHAGVGLNPDFVAGMRNHGNALEAMLLYMQDTWSDLALDPDLSGARSAGLATPEELMAAGYNSNPARLAAYARRGGAGWRTLIPRETQMYLQIYKSVDALMPFKSRVEQPRAPAPVQPLPVPASTPTP